MGKYGIARNQSSRFGEALRYQQTVEWITVMKRQLRDASCCARANWEFLKSRFKRRLDEPLKGRIQLDFSER